MSEHGAELQSDGADSQPMFDAVYSRLKVLADRCVRREHAVQLDATSLVHEAYLRLDRDNVGLDETRFLAFAAIAMRRILIERARQLRQLKRGGDRQQIPLSQVSLAEQADPVDVIDLESALAELEGINPGLCEIAVLRFLLGCSVEETARVLQLSTAKIVKDWRFARAWLTTRLESSD